MLSVVNQSNQALMNLRGVSMEPKVIILSTDLSKTRQIVLCKWRGEFVVWSYYPAEQAFEVGAYYKDLNSALANYKSRGGDL